MAESRSEVIDDLQLAVDSLAAFPARTAAGGADVTERLAAVADLCRSVDAVLDSLVVQAAAEAAEEGWTAARMAAEHSGYYARLRRALLPAGAGAGLTEQ
ncbi:hypothetical protein [Streptomyces rubellomurinus]|uniref:Uncharacterized protein n=2 Tax=Streptomyces TaxID=1883 RepID=A0A0F2TJC6_STRR3|nr:hypothetical protein [Streptomyces rubellomurinus]KJS57339.1 hypothetical protein VM98_01575 [Streptomyces rubellomurinus subsp. indigoferus]KJS61827.1 hypothetical protein VM95_12560 [Streptomyces rubellomurinus]